MIRNGINTSMGKINHDSLPFWNEVQMKWREECSFVEIFIILHLYHTPHNVLSHYLIYLY